MHKSAGAAVLTAGFLAVLPLRAAEDDGSRHLSVNGDLRLRYESIDEEGETDRNRVRFRARLGMSAAVSNDVTVVFQLATGGDNPVSTNQTLDEGFSTKDIGVDLAYVQWSASGDLTLYAGKIKNPLYRAGGAALIWDGDLNPEGFAATYRSDSFFANAGVFAVEERSSADDSLMYAGQAGMKVTVAGDASLTAGAGYFGYTDTVGNSPFYDASARGNTVDIEGNYVFEYRNVELFAQYDIAVNDWPLRIFAHATQNNEVDREDTAFALGAVIGSAKARGTAEYGWTYQDIEADAVIGTFSDSDFGGGGTDASGHVLEAKYMLRDRVALVGTLFVNEVDRFQATGHDYSRIQIDLEFRFD